MKKTIGIILFIIILITGVFYACSKTEKAIPDEVITSEITKKEVTTSFLTTIKTNKTTTISETTTSEVVTEITSDSTKDIAETHNAPPALSSPVIEVEIVPITTQIAVIETAIVTNPPETQTIKDIEAVGYRPIDKLSVDLQNHIYNLCVENGVEFAIVMAIIEKESGFNSGASNGVCIGLMQLHSSYNAGDLYDPYHNTTLGIQLIGRLVTTYGLSQGLVYYNCGEYSGVYAPTSYSNSIIAAAEKYK
jgi:hypothetical protein